MFADVSDHFGTLSKIKGINWEVDKQNIYYRKPNLSDEKWEQFNLDFQQSLQVNIPFPHPSFYLNKAAKTRTLFI